MNINNKGESEKIMKTVRNIFNKVVLTVGMLMMCTPLTTVVASAKSTSSSSSGSTFTGIVYGLIGAIIGAILVLGVVISMSRTKKKATEANDYIKANQGGNAEITGKSDRLIRTYTESRNKN